MKRSLIFIILTFSSIVSYAQNYDLIITTEGDSIACHIDSISMEAIHFEMKDRNNWIHTQINKSLVREYKLSAIRKITAKFKTGTSYLESKSYFESKVQIAPTSKINISGGIGLPEIINVGIRYQLTQTQLGICIGSFPTTNETAIAISGDIYSHFGGLSELSSRRPWYSRIGLNYMWDKKIEIHEDIFLTLRVGRDFNISETFGIEFDWGIAFHLMNTWGYYLPVIPSLGLGFYYRL